MRSLTSCARIWYFPTMVFRDILERKQLLFHAFQWSDVSWGLQVGFTLRLVPRNAVMLKGLVIRCLVGLTSGVYVTSRARKCCHAQRSEWPLVLNRSVSTIIMCPNERQLTSCLFITVYLPCFPSSIGTAVHPHSTVMPRLPSCFPGCIEIIPFPFSSCFSGCIEIIPFPL